MYNCRANDDPHGVFKLQQGSQKLQVSGNSRQLQFTVLREKGTFGAVDVQYEVHHSEWYPTEMKGAVTVPDKQSQVTKHLLDVTLQVFNSAAIQGKLSGRTNPNCAFMVYNVVLILESVDEI